MARHSGILRVADRVREAPDMAARAKALQGAQLRTLRERRHLPPSAVATALGYDKGAYANVEKGHLEGYDIRRRLAEFFDVDIQVLSWWVDGDIGWKEFEALAAECFFTGKPAELLAHLRVPDTVAVSPSKKLSR